jgi:hypothetical protein
VPAARANENSAARMARDQFHARSFKARIMLERYSIRCDHLSHTRHART